MITYEQIYKLLKTQKYVYLLDNWENCAIKIAKDEKARNGLRFWQKFRGREEFESHEGCKLVHDAILDSDCKVTMYEYGGTETKNTEFITEERYWRF